MKKIFAASVTCAIASLLGLLVLSADTVVPTAETFFQRVMLAAAASLVFWLSLALWARARLRVANAPSSPTPWVGQAVVVVAVIYVFGLLLLVGG